MSSKENRPADNANVADLGLGKSSLDQDSNLGPQAYRADALPKDK
jgi:hypothetical protein